MPEINLSGAVLDDGPWVEAVMYFPNDRLLRESWYAVNQAKAKAHQLDSTDKFELDVYTIKKLLDAPSYNELKDKTIESVKKGSVVGDMVASIYIMHIFDLPEPSMNKAIHVAKKFAKESKYGDGSPMRTSDKTIKKYLKEYMPVAHFWAAYRLNVVYPFSEGRSIFLDDLRVFLEVSQGIIEFGKSFVPSRKKSGKPVLTGGDFWTIPSNIPARNLKGGQFPDKLVEILESYDPMEYRY